MSSPLERTDAFTAASIAAYRCVCGELITGSGETVRCKKCNRQYAASVIQGATAETTVFNHDDTPRKGVVNKSVSSDGPDPNIGRMLGHYRVTELLGGGGMGKVYRAVDESLQRYVAIKVIHAAEGSSGEANLEQLFQEARTQARVNHAHVAHIYYVGMQEDTPFLAMELVGSSTMADRLKQGPLKFPAVVKCAQQVVDALTQAASFDIVHRDVKPSNILLVDEKNIKLSDFGMARKISELHGAGVIAGTPDYMAPEATRGEQTDHRGDMYSLGVTLFEMTFGRHPYPPVGDNVMQRLEQHRTAEPEFPEVWPEATPVVWRTVLEKLLAKDPSGRYASFAELSKALKQVEPAARPRAGILLRGVALMLDAMIIGLMFLVVNVVDFVLTPPGWQLAGSLASYAVEGSFLALVVLLQATWGTTPGKRLAQIRIIDRHGFQPGPWVMGMRTLFQFPFAWITLFSGLINALSGISVSPLLNLGLLFYVTIEAGFIIFGNGLSMHDRLFRTRVVLGGRRNNQRDI